MDSGTITRNIDLAIFDFGGVLAEKGFESGLRAIASANGLNAEHFYSVAHELIHRTGYLTGRIDEHIFWEAIRNETGIADNDTILRDNILSRFILRPWMFDIIKRLRSSGIGTVILSDQTNWLDELNRREDFFKHFDIVFNSYHLGKSKVDPSLFLDTIARLGGTPQRMVFIDDTGAHCETARRWGMNAIHFIDRESFLREIVRFFPMLAYPAPDNNYR